MTAPVAARGHVHPAAFVVCPDCPQVTGKPDATAEAHELTDRQRRVLQHAADGWGRAKSGRELGVSEFVVMRELRLIYARLGVSGRAPAVLAGLRAGVIR